MRSRATETGASAPHTTPMNIHMYARGILTRTRERFAIEPATGGVGSGGAQSLGWNAS